MSAEPRARHLAEVKGYVHPSFWSVAREVAKMRPRGRGGLAVCVYHRGEKVVDLWCGTRDPSGAPWEEDTVALSYSTTKGVVSTLLHVLADRGLIDYEEPVASYWPEFAAGGKERIRVRHLLCHEAGLYDIRQLVDHADRMLDWRYMTDALAAAAPLHEPGAAHGYHGLTYGWLLGEVIQRVTGKGLEEVLEAELTRPLGLDGLYIGLPEAQMHRRAHLLDADGEGSESSLDRIRKAGKLANRVLRVSRIPIDLSQAAAALMPPGMAELDFNSEALVAASIPAANGMFTARSLARMYAALANGGELEGVRLLSSTTLDRVTQVQNRGLGRVVPLSMQWRLGYHRVFAPGRRVGRAFGHFGFGGSGAWACPQRNLSLALVVNCGAGTPFGDARIVRLNRAALRTADRLG